MATAKNIHSDLTQQRLHELFRYDQNAGQFVRRVGIKGSAAGTMAGTVNFHGRHVMRVDGRDYQAHRLAWLYVHGLWPDDEIDHINGDPLDNRMANLREATSSQNKMNRRGARRDNKGGVRGVERLPSGMYRARYRLNGKSVHVGVYPTLDEAGEAATEARLRRFGEFAGA